jgi:hypothetical protein
MLQEHIDTNRRQNIHTLTAHCIHLKTRLQTRWTRDMADEQRRLVLPEYAPASTMTEAP